MDFWHGTYPRLMLSVETCSYGTIEILLHYFYWDLCQITYGGLDSGPVWFLDKRSKHGKNGLGVLAPPHTLPHEDNYPLLV